MAQLHATSPYQENAAHVPDRRIVRTKWPFSTYLVNHRYGFIYCPINKVACSTLKSWFLETTGHEYGSGSWPERIHPYLSERSMKDMGDLNKGYFKFVFVRNPWSRLASGYVQKFLGRWNVEESPSRPIVEAIYKTRGQLPDHEKSITFREFVDYVVAQEPMHLDEHWRPQHLFLGGLSFDFVGRLEYLQADFDFIVDKLGIPQRRLLTINRTDYCETIMDCVADWPGHKLRQLPNYPHYRQFYTDDLVRKVAEKYHQDIAMFEYDF